MKSLKIVAFIFLMGLSSGCLKTRAQLRDDSGDSNNSAPAAAAPEKTQVQEVQPQGGYAIDELKGTITQMEGRLEDVERSQKQPAGPSDEVKKLETRVTELEQAQAQMLEALKKIQETAPVADPAGLLEQGRNQYEAGNFEGTVETLSTYLKQPKAKKTEEATFLRAEAFYNLKQYKKAIVDYSKFPEKFTHSTKMPYVLYKIGMCFEELGMPDDAKGFYQELTEKFPKSAEAKKVRKKLK